MDDAPNPPERDYRETVFLPQTAFPMRAGLPKLEPEILRKWADQGLYAALRADRQAAGAELYVLHDGPPYANGDIHIGHALNKILKDFVVRSRFLMGFDVDYVPGWDCHGLPIEWKIEEQFRKEGRRKDEVSKAEFRTRCRAYAAEWIDKQRTEFQRLGVLGRWARPYATMDYASEAAIVKEFHKFKASGQLYRGSKPVMWSPVERTALADAEVEYHEQVSPMVWVKFPVWAYAEDGEATSDNPAGDNVFRLPPNDAAVVIWTTTPWTLPANRAIAYGPDIAYGLYEVEAMEAGLEFEPWAKPGDRLIVADKLADEVAKAAKIASWRRVEDLDPQGLICRHPLAELDAGYGFEVPLLAGGHVTDDAGTGFVHTAPGHGAEDYDVWIKSGRSQADIPDTVDPDGAYFPGVPLFAGLKVLETEGKKAGRFGPANGAVMDRLIEAGRLLARGRLEHSYPHSWRSKAPVIYRNTPQWFVRMDAPIPNAAAAEAGDNVVELAAVRMTLRETALRALAATAFHPAQGRNRITAMVEGRPDWLVSRQRAWGTPLAMYVDKRTGEPLDDPEVDARIVAAVAAEGADAWFTRPDPDFLGDHPVERFEKVEDILDVWFDSGSTHAFTLEGRETGPDRSRSPADLYLEGSDQHRGWFQSSLLESCGTRGRAPYKAVLTHGFTLDETGEKMSKSKGNTTEPQAVIADSGADILRLWVAMADYAEDQRIGKTILQTTSDAYRKLRNTLRYLLGALEGFTPEEAVGLEAMPPLERYVLHRLAELDATVRAAYAEHRYQDVVRPVAEFCSNDLSAFYFDVRKDSLYCDTPAEPRRRAARTVMNAVFERLTAWLSPILAFTTDEAWSTRFPQDRPNAFRTLPDTPADWLDPALAEDFARAEGVLEAVTAALEIERREKRIGSALEAAPRVRVTTEQYAALERLAVQSRTSVDAFAADLFRTSQASVIADSDGAVAVEPLRADGNKCRRSWKVLPEVTAETGWLTLRDAAAVAWWDERRAQSEGVSS